MKKPFFSIIVTSFNAEKTIKETINSVLIQTCEDYEIIVKDACSKDNTLKTIPKNNNSIHVVSKKDKGVYDGMNQAIEKAKGEYLFFLNCGDIFFDKFVLEKVKNSIVLENKKYDIVYGDYTRKDLCVLKQPSTLNEFQLIRKPLTHQSIFFRFNIFEKIGLYNLKYKLCADYDLTVKALLKGYSFLHINEVICVYEGGGISETNKQLLHQEAKEIRKQFHIKTRIIHKCYLVITLSIFREWIVSEKSPKWIRSIYRNLRNKTTK